MSKRTLGNSASKDPLQKELEAIKRLLMLFLYKTGTKQAEVAAALQIDQAEASRMMPVSKISKYNLQGLSK